MKPRPEIILEFAVLVAFIAALALLPPAGAHAQDANPIGIEAAKILNFKLGDPGNQFGDLKFLGGLELQSDDRNFGGISGFRLLPDRTRFIAVTDKGHWISGEFKRDITGALDDVLLADIGLLPDPDGNIFTRKRDADAEALELAGGKAVVAFEGNDRINIYPFAGGRISGNPVAVFPQVTSLRLARNKGLEALAKMSANPQGHEFIAIAEESLNPSGNHRAFLLSAGGIAELSIARNGEFGITDADFLPGGDLVILERSYSPLAGPAIQLRRIAGETISPGAVLDGEILLSADKNFRIDNLESLDISTGDDGSIHFTLVSDDNFSALQHTIVLEFKYPG